MSEQAGTDLDGAASQLVQKLMSAREAKADAPEADRKTTFRRILDEELGAQPPDRARRVVGAVRERLIADARARDARVDAFESETAELRRELQSATSERDALRAELTQLRSAVASAPAEAAPTSGSLESIRTGLMMVSDGEDVKSESLGLPEADARLFRLIKQLLTFCLNSENSFNFLVDTFRIGPGMDSVQAKLQAKEVRGRFQACLNNEEGAVTALQESLKKIEGFLIDLNRAYESSLYDGSKALLSELDPLPLADKHRKPIIGLDAGEAWKAIGRAQNDLASLSKGELWERFYFEPFRKKLASYLDK